MTTCSGNYRKPGQRLGEFF